MDILRYIIFAILPILLGFILIIFIDYFDKISGRKLYTINHLKYIVIRSKKRNNQNKTDSISFSAAFLQAIHYTLIVVYFITGYLIFSFDGLRFSLSLAYGISIYGFCLLVAVIYIFVKTIVKESKK